MPCHPEPADCEQRLEQFCNWTKSKRQNAELPFNANNQADSGSIHLSVIDINRFRVKHGMTKLGDNRFFTSLGERSQLCESNELQMRVRVNHLLSA